MSYNYNDLIAKTIIKGKNFNGSKTPADISSSLVSCNDIKKMTIDTLLYMHIYTGLYLSLIEYNKINNDNIEKFDMIVKNLKIFINTTDTNSYMHSFNESENKTYTFYLRNFISNYKSETNVGYKNYNDDININKHKPILTNINTLTGEEIGIDDTEIANIGNTAFDKTNIGNISNPNSNNRLNKLKEIITEILNTKTENIQAYLKYYSCFYQMILYNISIQVSIRTFYLNAINSSSPYVINTKIGSGALIKTDGIRKTYKTKFTGGITKQGGGFQLGDIIELNNNDNTIPYKAKCVVSGVGEFGVITSITVEDGEKGYGYGYVSTISMPHSYSYKRKNGTSFTPISEPELRLETPAEVIYIPMNNYGSGYYINPDVTGISISGGGTITYEFRKDLELESLGILYIIGTVSGGSGGGVITDAPTIVPKQTTISGHTFNSISGMNTQEKVNFILQAINTNIYDMINNINNLNINSSKYKYFKSELNDEYTVQKMRYIEKIKLLNSLKQEYTEYQNNINYKIRLYNDHTKNFKKIKNYANYIIYFLVFIIVLTLILSILPSISSNIKFTYYVVLIITLSILISLYYNNFKNSHLNENFTDYTSSIITNNNCSTPAITYNSGSNSDREIHSFMINKIQITLINYYSIYNDFQTDLKVNITTIGTDVFTRNNDEYLYNIYLTKQNEIKMFKIKKIELTNSIEIIKREIIYLFNVILFIGLFTVVLILGLLLYTIIPTMIKSIIILCVILLVFIVVYFMFVLSYPTRLIANKNYWAPKNPSSKVISKLG